MWYAILLVVMMSGQVNTEKVSMDEVGLPNTSEACVQFIHEFEARMEGPHDGVDHFRLACIQE